MQALTGKGLVAEMPGGFGLPGIFLAPAGRARLAPAGGAASFAGASHPRSSRKYFSRQAAAGPLLLADCQTF